MFSENEIPITMVPPGDREVSVHGVGFSASDTVLTCFTCSILSNLHLVRVHFLFRVYFCLQHKIKKVAHVLTAST